MYTDQPIFQETDIHVDIETLGTRADSVILSIGACLRDPRSYASRKALRTFYVVIDPHQPGRHTDEATLVWWGKPDQAEAKALLDEADKYPLRTALNEFARWLRMSVPEEGSRVMWGNGSDFDNAILAHAFSTLGLPVPWSFWNNESLRTLKRVEARLCTQLRRNTTSRVRPSVAHSAIADAEAQLLWAEAMQANIARIARG